jgi:hypothetical protein
MENHKLTPGSLLQLSMDDVREWMWPTLLAIFLFSCLATRIITALKSWPDKRTDAGRPRLVRVVPYWIPWLGHSVPFGWDHIDFVRRARFVLTLLSVVES